MPHHPSPDEHAALMITMGKKISRAFKSLGGRDLAVLVGATFLIAATCAFILLTWQVSRGNTRAFDTRLLMALRVPGDLKRPIGPEWLLETARDATALGSTFVLALVTIGMVVYLALDRRYRAMAFLASSVIGGWMLSSGLKGLIARPRPDLVPHLMQAFYSSYPSGHSMMSAVVYLTQGGLLASLVAERRLRIYLFSLAVALTGVVGVSRVYLGVHYPTDVLAGWTAGAAWVTLCFMVGHQLRRQAWVEGTARPAA